MAEAFPDLAGFDTPAQWLLKAPPVRTVLQDAANESLLGGGGLSFDQQMALATAPRKARGHRALG